MSKKQANALSMTIIHELAQIRAVMSHLSEIVLDDIGNRRNFSDADKAALRSAFRANTDAKAKKFYDHYLKEVGLPETDQT